MMVQHKIILVSKRISIVIGILLANFTQTFAGNTTSRIFTIEPGDSSVFYSQAKTPPMGWNSWNWFGKQNINEQIVKQVIDALSKEGMQKLGYEYIVVDGGWRDVKLSPKGELLPNPTRFPGGMKALADYAHSKGFKFGLHTVPGTHDCGGDPVGGFGNEEVQVQQFIDWGVDFIKLDRCKFSDTWNEPLIEKTYRKWSELIEKSGKSIILNVSAYKFRDWNPEACQMSRTTLDIAAKANGAAKFDYIKKNDNFHSVMQVAEQNNEVAHFARPGYWNDPDMLVIGSQGLSVEEQKSHFALWCIMSSPLFLGNDPRFMTIEEKAIIKNKLAISINQDPTEQGVRIKLVDGIEVWVKKLKNNQLAVLFLNRSSFEPKQLSVRAEELGMRGTVMIEDVYESKPQKTVTGKITRNINPQTGWFVLLSGK